MFVQSVVVGDNRRSSPLRGHRMAPHRVDLRNNSNSELWIELRNRYGRTQTGATTANQKNIV